MLAVVFLLASQSPALNAPVVDGPPTVASELRRGWDSGQTCPITWLNMQRIDRCIEAARLANAASHSNTDAFDLGLKVAQWNAAFSLAGVLGKSTSRGAVLERDVDLASAQLYASEIKSMGQKLNLTKADLAAVLPAVNKRDGGDAQH